MTSRTPANPSEWSLRYPSADDSYVVRRDLPYSATDHTERLMDVYLPTHTDGAPGAIIVASGYPKSGLTRYFSRSAREFGAARSWGALLASHGIAAIAYDAPQPAIDLPMLIEFVTNHGVELGIDPTRLGILASSGNTPVALANLDSSVRCAVMLYGFMFDSNDRTVVADAAQQFGFANPNSQHAMKRIDEHVRMLIVRAGRDAFAGLNDTIDTFVATALARNLALTVINQPDAQHAFDLLDESEETKRVIEKIVEFLVFGVK